MELRLNETCKGAAGCWNAAILGAVAAATTTVEQDGKERKAIVLPGEVRCNGRRGEMCTASMRRSVVAERGTRVPTPTSLLIGTADMAQQVPGFRSSKPIN